ncbi:MAG: vancomycin high temperature exclusion protein [Candidatus Sericytochromatia bacterium]
MSPGNADQTVDKPKPRRWRRRAMILLMLLTLLTASYQWVAMQGQQGLYHELAAVPFREHAMLLGTAPTSNGRPNPYYVHRIEATLALWRAGKFHDVIASGSRRLTRHGLYDEIAAMRRDLIKAGIPPDRILADPEAHRTLLSIQRAQSVFELYDYLIITQAFHCERSLFIARDLGQNPICYAAEDVANQPLMLGRELISRLVAVAEASGR